ncbi:uncharacterized protein TEOVI_000111500 [Trypanosoma equiperdum]|nr:hypothetical protein, conserved [Trypanosoma equiperdum]
MRCHRVFTVRFGPQHRCNSQWSPHGAPECGGQRPVSDAVERDTSSEWMQTHISRAVEEGRHTKEAAAYFESIMNDKPEFRLFMREAQRLIGDQDPRGLTRYQQTHYSEKLSRYMSGVASERLMRAHTEDENTRRHTHDGSPTGENYWFEAGQILASPTVPSFVKDEVLREMRGGRKEDSPAFEEPKAVAEMEADDEGFAEHLRRQRKRLLSPDDHLN